MPLEPTKDINGDYINPPVVTNDLESTTEHLTKRSTSTKKVWIAYLLWFFLGWWGIHHIYLRRDRQAFLWFALFGGYFGIGWFRDIWHIPSYVKEANEDPQFLNEFNEKREKYPNKPPFSFVRALCEVVVGNSFSWLFTAAIPNEEIYGYDIKWLVHVVAPISIALGVHTVGNIGREKGNLLSLIQIAYGSYLLLFITNIFSSNFTAFICAVVFEKRIKKWRKEIKRKRSSIRFLTILGSVLLYSCLFSSYLFFNAEVTDNNGEKVKLRVAVQNFFESPMWKEFVSELGQLYNFVKAHGFYKVWEELINKMDLQGENNAIKVLGVPAKASQEEITAAYRKLSKQWHPDRHKDLTAKLEAQEKFMQIQQAYERISDLKSRRQEKNKIEL